MTHELVFVDRCFALIILVHKWFTHLDDGAEVQVLSTFDIFFHTKSSRISIIAHTHISPE